MNRLIRTAVALLLGFSLVAAACSDDDSSNGSSSADDSTPSTAEVSEEIVVADAWARTSAMGQDLGAAYMVITGGAEDDALVSGSVPADIAGEVQLHETTDGSAGASTDDSMGDMGGDMAGGGGETMMGMREVTQIDIPAGAEVRLEPGGYHVMLLDLPAPLTEGQTFDLTLTFEQAGEIVVPVEVRER